MELEFDKEIDAILRKSSRGSVAAGNLASAHLEADEIAAFAENALPQGVRSLCIKHLAACDRCRSILSQTIALYPEAEAQAASSAVSADSASSLSIPWYRKLFVTPNLAASMGVLVVAFVSLLGYLVYQQNFAHQSEVARLNESESRAAANRPTPETAAPNFNSAANTANTAANTAQPPVNAGSSSVTKTQGQEGPVQPGPSDDKSDSASENDRLRIEQQPIAPAAAPLAKEEPKTEAENNKLAEKKPESNDTKSAVTVDGAATGDTNAMKDASVQNSQVQNNSLGGALKPKSGPYRDMQQRSVMPSDKKRSDEESFDYRVGGKSFQKKDGVWYDSAYRGQATTNIRRGTTEYRSLDNGLRSIAESMSGTVIVVWKEKAYRIQ